EVTVSRAEGPLRLRFMGARGAAITGEGPLPGTSNYLLLGADPAAFHTSIPTFERVRYAGLYRTGFARTTHSRSTPSPAPLPGALLRRLPRRGDAFADPWRASGPRGRLAPRAPRGGGHGVAARPRTEASPGCRCRI